ncbi:TerB family tellurite resistance protein [Proteiniclasticum sp. C24MP]|uniref:TerB family tellurite resistance protein n=1 Tax=Proteiniclasticum sp. C24MP TaxID=3374101 RepID=UPI0037542196
MELIIIGFVIWYFYSKYFKQPSGNQVNCPYCRKRLHLNGPGSYNCHHCRNMFHYKSDGQVLRGEESINEGLSMLAVLYAKLAKADGMVTENEIHAIDHILKIELEMNSVQRKEFISIFNQSKEMHHDLKKVAGDLCSFYNDHIDVLEFIIHSLFTISALDGGRKVSEEEILKDAVHAFYPRTGKTYEQYHHGASTSHASSQTAPIPERLYEVLECDPEDTDQVVKQSYRRLIQKYHPDKYQSKDLPEDMVEYGSRRFMEIQEAYKEIRKQRNFV